jgi:hypothetical protein
MSIFPAMYTTRGNVAVPMKKGDVYIEREARRVPLVLFVASHTKKKE